MPSTTKGKMLVKKYNCFTPELQSFYDHLNNKQRLYVDFRGQGYNKTDAYKMAGYKSTQPGVTAYGMERKDNRYEKCINAILNVTVAQAIAKDEDNKHTELIQKMADANAPTDTIGNGLDIAKIDNETARRIDFYRDITLGRIKTVKEIREYNAEGKLVKRRVEETDDLETKMKARKELDRLLGLNSIIDLGSVACGGDITINIVDASKKDEPDLNRDNVVEDIGFDESDIKVDENGEKIVIVDTEDKKV